MADNFDLYDRLFEKLKQSQALNSQQQASEKFKSFSTSFTLPDGVTYRIGRQMH